MIRNTLFQQYTEVIKVTVGEEGKKIKIAERREKKRIYNFKAESNNCVNN